MATKYRIVEEGRAVYIEYRGWLFWNRITESHAFSAFAPPAVTGKNFGTVDAARAEIDRRLAFEAGQVPRVTEYPNQEERRQQELEAARRRSHDYGPTH